MTALPSGQPKYVETGRKARMKAATLNEPTKSEAGMRPIEAAEPWQAQFAAGEIEPTEFGKFRRERNSR